MLNQIISTKTKETQLSTTDEHNNSYSNQGASANAYINSLELEQNSQNNPHKKNNIHNN